MAILLWIGGTVAFFAGMPQLGFAVWLVNIINGVFSFWQENRASQSTLTGESNPVRKTKGAVLKDDITPSETPNLIFAGTSVSEGNGKAIVMEIGMKTEFGKIADLTQNMKEETSPLQKEMDRLTKQISVIANIIKKERCL